MKIADMHCDTISEIWESRQRQRPQKLCQNQLHVDIQKMKKAGYVLQNFAMYIDLKRQSDPFEYVCELIDVFYEELAENKNDISVIKTYQDILENEKQGKISAMMTIEEGGCCKGELEKLEKLYQLGARMMTLTWNYPNELAYPNMLTDQKDRNGFYIADYSRGLTEKGFDFIERMEELGIIIDVSHLSDAGFWDIVKHTKKPFAASHSNARALCAHSRNLDDDMIQAIAGRGGVIGLNYYGCFLNETNDSDSSVLKIARHARHIVKTGGIACLGLGSDFDGIDGTLEMEDCSQMDKLVSALEKQHFTGSEIDRILYQNVLNLYRELL
ncbi:MAG: dipeptidase [Lachnospiraceae bacterium]|nr:dipeptidase [Lachnospiraceae bacterium]